MKILPGQRPIGADRVLAVNQQQIVEEIAHRALRFGMAPWNQSRSVQYSTGSMDGFAAADGLVVRGGNSSKAAGLKALPVQAAGR
jgi:hypothetical protein